MSEPLNVGEWTYSAKGTGELAWYVYRWGDDPREFHGFSKAEAQVVSGALSHLAALDRRVAEQVRKDAP